MQVGLLRARRHAGGRAAALHVDDRRRDLGEVGEADELGHQRHARAGRRRERARAVPARADHHADRGELVLRLHDRELVAPGRLVDAIAAAVLLERLGHRRRRRDRIPGADRGAAVHGPEGGGRVALDEDAIADVVAPLDPQAERAGEVLVRVVSPGLEGLEVRLDQLVLALVLLAEQLRDHFRLDAEQRRQHADVHDVLQELALLRVGEPAGGDGGQRHADRVDVGAEARRRHRLRAVVEQVAARLDLRQVPVPGLRVHRDHQVDAAAAAEVALFGHAHLVPGRQALDVRREDVARRHRHAHPQDAAREQLVGGGRPGAVDVGELDDEVVGRADAAMADHGAAGARTGAAFVRNAHVAPSR